MKITLCIPCVDKHIPLLINLLKTIPKFSRKPDNIMIGLSPKFNNIELNTEKEKLLTLFPDLPLTIIVQNKKTIAAEHLNNMGKLINDGFIVRADADDIIHPQKLEIIEKILEKYPDTKLILHKCKLSTERNYNMTQFSNITDSCFKNFIFKTEAVQINNSIFLCSDLFNKKYNQTRKNFLDKCNCIHYGACCYSYDVLDNIQYEHRNWSEDRNFAKAVTKFYTKTIYLDIYLNKFTPSGSWR